MIESQQVVGIPCLTKLIENIRNGVENNSMKRQFITNRMKIVLKKILIAKALTKRPEV